MNRQIKFRGKSTVTKEWVYGDLLTIHGIHKRYNIDYERYEIRHDPPGTDPAYIDVDSSTVGQYTELKDKNGREIYEGDVLLYETPYGDYFGYVAHRYGGYCVLGLEPVEWDSELDIVDVMAMDDVDLRPVFTPMWEGEARSMKMHPCGECAEIIGNVHDNALFNNLPSRYENVAYIRRQIEQAEIFSYDFQRRLDYINNKLSE